MGSQIINRTNCKFKIFAPTGVLLCNQRQIDTRFEVPLGAYVSSILTSISIIDIIGIFRSFTIFREQQRKGIY